MTRRPGSFESLAFLVVSNQPRELNCPQPGWRHEHERAVQLKKGGYSFRRKKELGFNGEIWQRGFSEVRINDRKSFVAHKEYIDDNPVEARLAARPEDYPYCSAYLRKKKEASG